MYDTAYRAGIHNAHKEYGKERYCKGSNRTSRVYEWMDWVGTICHTDIMVRCFPDRWDAIELDGSICIYFLEQNYILLCIRKINTWRCTWKLHNQYTHVLLCGDYRTVKRLMLDCCKNKFRNESDTTGLILCHQHGNSAELRPAKCMEFWFHFQSNQTWNSQNHFKGYRSAVFGYQFGKRDTANDTTA